MKNTPLALLDSCGAVITYSPLQTEVPFRDFVTVSSTALIHEIPPRASLDPTIEAHRAAATVGTRKTCIFIPGRRFDSTGTRHGQGGGWYDRFLAAAPKQWMRIGFCYANQFSEKPLVREAWDQAMDWVCVVDAKTKKMSVYETRRRVTM